jgi:cytochrome c oxidase cbb3-type subunit IV
MYKNVLQSIDNIAVWPVISFVIFFAFFLGLLLWVLFADKKFIEYMKNMPIQDSAIKKSSTSITDSHVQP